MTGDRIESAVQRIEAALARIGEAADRPRPEAAAGTTEAPVAVPPSVSSLVVKHEELRETVTNTLKELDDLIGKLET